MALKEKPSTHPLQKVELTSFTQFSFPSEEIVLSPPLHLAGPLSYDIHSVLGPKGNTNIYIVRSTTSQLKLLALEHKEANHDYQEHDSHRVRHMAMALTQRGNASGRN